MSAAGACAVGPDPRDPPALDDQRRVGEEAQRRPVAERGSLVTSSPMWRSSRLVIGRSVPTGARVRRRRREHQHLGRRAGTAGAPGVEVDGDQIGALADGDPPAVGEARATRGRPGSPRRAARRPTSVHAPGSPAARASRRRASPRTGRSRHGCPTRASAASPRRGGSATVRCRRRGRVRWWGRSTRYVPDSPSSRTSSSVRWVAWTAVVIGPSTPSSASRWVGVTPCTASHASFSATCSDRCTCSGSPRAYAHSRDGLQLVARHRSHRMDGRADPGVAERLDPLGPAGRVAVAEPSLHPLGLLAEAARQVAGVEQPDPDTGLVGGRRAAPCPSRWDRRTACRRAGGAGSGTPRPR